MGKETEHKYIVVDDSYKDMSSRHYTIRQGYLSRDIDRTVRIRLRDDKGFITVKGRNIGDTRAEFEYEIPAEDARRMLDMCEPPVIVKTRYIVEWHGHIWEVDNFTAPREMTVAEIELPSSDTPYDQPPFVGKNVTGDPAYYNSQL